MAISTVVFRPVNLFRSQSIRAKSPHTSSKGLVALYYGMTDRSGKEAVVNNLSNRIETGALRLANAPDFREELFAKISNAFGNTPDWFTACILSCNMELNFLAQSKAQLRPKIHKELIETMGKMLSSEKVKTVKIISYSFPNIGWDNKEGYVVGSYSMRTLSGRVYYQRALAVGALTGLMRLSDENFEMARKLLGTQDFSPRNFMACDK